MKAPANQTNSLLAHIGTNVVTLMAAWLLFAGTQGANEATMLESAFVQIERQSTQIIELRQLLVDAQLEIVNLKAELTANLTREDLLSEYLNTLPFPAWIKQYEPDNDAFVVVMVNESYTREYGITNSEYVGKTDFDVHPHDLAKSYNEADRVVLSKDRSDVRRQKIMNAEGREIDIIVYKFPVRIGQGLSAVGGVAIKSDIFAQKIVGE